jgi:hypothetical protein
MVTVTERVEPLPKKPKKNQNFWGAMFACSLSCLFIRFLSFLTAEAPLRSSSRRKGKEALAIDPERQPFEKVPRNGRTKTNWQLVVHLRNESEHASE